MARVLLLSAAPEDDPGRPYARHNYEKLRACAEKDAFHVHTLTGDPRGADVILFAEARGAGLFFEDVRRHPYVKAFRDKCFLFSEIDQAIPFLPGVYASLEKRWYSRQWVRSGHYVRRLGEDFLPFAPGGTKQPYLYSFIGAVDTAGVRRSMAGLDHARGFFLDTSSDKARIDEIDGHPAEREHYRRRYVRISQQSTFILCPRGIGTSSMRLFECMQMGRAPVIISDQWVPPEGPAWEDFSVRIAERDVAHIPQILEAREADARRMGLQAREAWEAWFSEEVSFHRIVEWCLSIQATRKVPEQVMRYAAFMQLLRPCHFRQFAGTRFRSLKQTMQGRLVRATS